MRSSELSEGKPAQLPALRVGPIAARVGESSLLLRFLPSMSRRASPTYPPVSLAGLERDQNGISLVIASYRAPEETLTCLESVSRQTLSRSRFEVILVVNGPQADDTLAYRRFSRDHPDLQLRVIRSPLAGACHALNLGIEAARMNWVTFLDDDDTITEQYLEGLLSVASPGVISLTLINDVNPDGTVSTSNRINEQIRPLSGRIVPPENCPRGLAFNASKLIPTDWARHILYDTHLASGQDIAFYGALYLTYDFSFAIVPEEMEAIYCRSLSHASQSRRALDFAFAVEERLDVIESLDRRFGRTDPGKHPLVKSTMRSQALFIRRYLDDNPEDRNRVNSAIRARTMSFFPWEVLTEGTAEKLVVSVCFAPYSDASAVTVAKRMLDSGEVADVVSCDMASVRPIDSTLVEMVTGLAGTVDEVAASVSFANWSSARDFTLEGWRRLEHRLRRRWPYERLYSRAMWPASHVLAALIKLRRPATRWTAEFSDPLSRNVEGAVRISNFQTDDLVEELMAGVRASSALSLPDPRSLFELAEILPFAMADELVFTNQVQLDYMLSYCPSPLLAELARSKAVVRPHPVPAAELYALVQTDCPAPAHKAKLAYFGGFYASRSLNDVLAALSNLRLAVRREIALDIYTDDRETLEKTIAAQSLFDVVTVHPTVSYLAFLNLTTKYDCLIVEDARTEGTHDQNPYLPSKWSDYLGSGTPIWALTEPGSTLSGLDPEYSSRLGSTEEAATVLSELAEEFARSRPPEAQAKMPAPPADVMPK